jgi:hypothetical protein
MFNNGKIREELVEPLTDATKKIAELVQIFIDSNIDVADACNFTNTLIIHWMKKNG